MKVFLTGGWCDIITIDCDHEETILLTVNIGDVSRVSPVMRLSTKRVVEDLEFDSFNTVEVKGCHICISIGTR